MFDKLICAGCSEGTRRFEGRQIDLSISAVERSTSCFERQSY